MIGWPATASATLGTGPRAEASTTPWRFTKLSQRLAGGRPVDAARLRGRLAAARLVGWDEAGFFAAARFRAGARTRAGLAVPRRVDDFDFGRLPEVGFAVRVLGFTGG